MDGQRFSIKNGLLDIFLNSFESQELVMSLSRVVLDYFRRVTLSCGEPEEFQAKLFEKSSRISRMCYELSLNHELTSLSLEDVQILYDLRLDARLDFLFKILNAVRAEVRKSGIDDVLEGHRAVKSLVSVFEF